jgi:hypothetical protein
MKASLNNKKKKKERKKEKVSSFSGPSQSQI